MKIAELGTTGLTVSRVGFGGIPIQRLDENDSINVVQAALDHGCSLIDTARVYTDSEEKIGRALEGTEERPVLVSKTYSRDAQGAMSDVDVSCQNLGVDCVDVYLTHNIGSQDELEEVLGPEGAVAGLQMKRKEGTVNHVGISSHKPDVLQEALDHEVFSVIEVPFSAIETESLDVLKRAAREGVGTIVMKPLAGGALEMAACALKFVLEHPVDCVIPGMQTIEEVEENLGVTGGLSDAEREQLMAQAAEWGDRFCRRCEYCLAVCPNDINITKILLFATYAERYGLEEWARERYDEMPIHADACDECGRCEERCPYDLPVRDMLADAHAVLMPEK